MSSMENDAAVGVGQAAHPCGEGRGVPVGADRAEALAAGDDAVQHLAVVQGRSQTSSAGAATCRVSVKRMTHTSLVLQSTRRGRVVP